VTVHYSQDQALIPFVELLGACLNGTDGSSQSHESSESISVIAPACFHQALIEYNSFVPYAFGAPVLVDHGDSGAFFAASKRDLAVEEDGLLWDIRPKSPDSDRSSSVTVKLE